MHSKYIIYILNVCSNNTTPREIPGSKTQQHPVQPETGGRRARRSKMLQHSYQCLRKNTPFTRALAMQPGGGNCNPAPDSELSKLTFQPVFFSGGLFCLQTQVVHVELPPASFFTQPSPHKQPAWLGRHYLSNATCLMRPRLLDVFFVVSRIAII